MKKFSKGLFAFLAIAFVMGLSAMVVSAKEVSISPENFPDENLRKALEEYRIRETKMVWDEDEEEWYEENVYEEKEYYDEDIDYWYTEKIPVYKKDADGNYIIDIEEKLEATGWVINSLPSEIASNIKTIRMYGGCTSEVLDLSAYTSLKEFETENLGASTKKIIFNSNIDSVIIGGAPNLTKIEIPKNNKLTLLALLGCKKIKKLDLKNYKKLTFFGVDRNIELKNIPSKLKSIGVQTRTTIKPTTLLGKGYKQNGKMTDVEYNSKKGTYSFWHDWTSSATFVKGSKKIKIYAVAYF